MNWAPALPVAIGVILGGGVTLFVGIIKYRLDAFAIRYDELSKQIIYAADLSSEYWLLQVSYEYKDSDNDVKLNIFQNSQLFEAKIKGTIQQILLSNEYLFSEMPKEARKI